MYVWNDRSVIRFDSNKNPIHSSKSQEYEPIYGNFAHTQFTAWKCETSWRFHLKFCKRARRAVRVSYKYAISDARRLRDTFIWKPPSRFEKRRSNRVYVCVEMIFSPRESNFFWCAIRILLQYGNMFYWDVI